MTAPLDLEALSDVRRRISEAVQATHDSRSETLVEVRELISWGHAIDAVLTTRRARDAEFEVLVAAAQGFFDAQCSLDNREAMGPNADDHDVLMRRRNAARRGLDDALVTFTGATP